MASNTSLHHLAREVTNRPTACQSPWRRDSSSDIPEHTGACGRSWRWQGSNVSAVKLIRFLAAASLFVVGVMIVLYGLLALTFNEPRGGSTYVTLAGHRLDAHAVGAVSFLLGFAVIAAAVAVLRHGRVRS